jgi:hypothetical protein
VKLNESPLLPVSPSSDYGGRLNVRLAEIFRATAVKVNRMAAGSFSGFDGALTAPPTTGTWAQGDQVRNSAPVELGVVTAKYVIEGWICTVGGTPGTWLQQRTLTGN